MNREKHLLFFSFASCICYLVGSCCVIVIVMLFVQKGRVMVSLNLSGLKTEESDRTEEL